MSDAQTTVGIAPNNPLPNANQVGCFTITWEGPSGPVTAVIQATSLTDALSGLPLSVTPAGTDGVNAAAIQGITGGVPIPVDPPAWTCTPVTAVGNTPITGEAGILGAIVNLDSQPQNFAITAFDNPSSNSGTQIYGRTGLTQTDPNPIPQGGAKTTTGITVNLAQAAVGAGVLVYWRAV